MILVRQGPDAPNPMKQAEGRADFDLKGLINSLNGRLDLSMIRDSPQSSRFAMTGANQSGLALLDLSSQHIGRLTAQSLVVDQLSSLTANIGKLVINKGGSVSSGETAYATGTGFWLGTDPSGNPQFSLVDSNGNYVKFDGSSPNPVQISSTGLIGALSSKQVDDGAWKTLASYRFITGLPTTRSGYGITDAQGTLPVAAGVGYVLQQDNSGAPYYSQKYGAELNCFAADFGSAGFTSNSFVQLGSTFGIVRPAINCTLNAILSFLCVSNLGTPGLNVEFDYSTDGGTTWTVGQTAGIIANNTGNSFGTLVIKNVARGTGDFQVRCRCENTAGANTITVVARAIIYLCPNNNFYTITGALSSSIPATGTGNCNATFPATTCTASVNVTVTPGGGTPPYTYIWAIVSGTGTITAGSTSQTVTISDTETATAGGANFNTTINCKVTDSVPNNVTSSNDVITNTFTLVYAAISGSVANNDGSCTKQNCGGGGCTASGTLTANATGGNGSYTYSWSVTSGGGTITSGATAQTATIQQTHTAVSGGVTVSTTCQCATNDTRGTGSVNLSGTVNLTFYCNS